MPRDLPIGNGNLLINYDADYIIRDLYFPYVGQENHTLGHPCRTGLWVDGDFLWLDDPAWARVAGYAHDTLVTQVTLANDRLDLALAISDTVDFEHDLFIRQINVINHRNAVRHLRLFFHYAINLYSSDIGDTVYYQPKLKAMLAYRGQRYFLFNGQAGGEVGLSAYACGQKTHGAEGTWRDAEDGELSGNPIAQGSVDCTVGLYTLLPDGGNATIHHWVAAGKSYREVKRLDQLARSVSPARLLERTTAYWRRWVRRHEQEDALSRTDLPAKLTNLYRRSLLILRTQVDNRGAILAANDSDNMSFNRDTYSYVWPRDGALIAAALDSAGMVDLARRFFNFCAETITEDGYLLHKYTPDGSLGSSWHPWVGRGGEQQLPIQEDETGLVLHALWQHYQKYTDLEFITPLYSRLIKRAADFMAEYREPRTGLPEACYDLWEERRGIWSFTVAAVWAGLNAAANFAEVFGERALATRYATAASEIKAAALAHLWDAAANRFRRGLCVNAEGSLQPDLTIDSSIYGLFYFGMLPADDPRVVSTMEAVRRRLWCKTEVGGIARYENDYFHRVSDDIDNVAGNPWLICTLWQAQWHIARARRLTDLAPARELLEWAARYTAPSGVMAEQLDPYSGAAMSVAPLTWSHGTFAATVLEYAAKHNQLTRTPSGAAKSVPVPPSGDYGF